MDTTEANALSSPLTIVMSGETLEREMDLFATIPVEIARQIVDMAGEVSHPVCRLWFQLLQTVVG